MNQKGFGTTELLLVILVVAVAGIGYFALVAPATQAIPGDGAGSVGGTSQNPSLEFSVLDKRTQSADNEATVRLLNSEGNIVKTGTTTSGVLSLTNLQPNTNYTVEVVQPGSTTAFYPLTATAATANAGPVNIPLLYSSVANTAPTITVYNFDNITTNATAQSVGANDSGTYRIRLRTASSTNDNNFFGGGSTPLLFVVDHNSLAYSRGFSMKGTDGITILETGGTPAGHTIVDANRNSTTAFLANINQAAAATDYDFFLTVKSGSQEPINSGDANCGLKVSIYDGSRIQNTLTGSYVNAYVNPVSAADLGAANWTAFMNCL